VKRLSAGRTKGEGIAAANIHWWVLGTDERTLDSGQPTGKMQPVFEDCIQQALAASQGKVLAASRKAITRAIEREAAKG